MKIEDITSEEGRSYVRLWIPALQVLLGWSEEQTLKWAEKWENDLNEPTCLFFHETEVFWILDLVIPSRFRQRLKGNYSLLHRSVLGVVEDTDSFNYYQNPNFDWNLAKKRIEVFLAEVEQQEDIVAFLLKTQEMRAAKK